MRVRIFFAAVVLTAFVCAAGYLLVFPRTTIQYKVQFELEIEGHPVELNSVWQVEYIAQATFDGLFPSLVSHHVAQAANAALPAGRLVFITIADKTFTSMAADDGNWGNIPGIPIVAMSLTRQKGPAIVRAIREASRAGSRYSLNAKMVPPIWVLPDEQNLSSIYRVNLCEIKSPCSARFVSGLMTFTSEPPRKDIFTIFPWISEWKRMNPLFHGGIANEFS